MSSLMNKVRSRSGGSRFASLPVPVFALLGLLLVPLTIAGLLTWSLGNPDDRIEDVKAAVVNADEPVEVNGQLAPLGRQLAATLVGDDIESNYSWEFANEETAQQGLENGEYVAVVTIPENFSQAATSFSRDPAQTEQAQIDVTTGERSRIVDEAINQYVTSTAADLLGEQLTTTYLDNVLVGFNTLNDQLGEASTGASSLADGAEQLAGGGTQLADGADQLAGGTHQLSDGLSALDDGAAQLSGGLEQLRERTAEMPDQVATLADVAAKESEGVHQLDEGIGTLAGNLQDMQKRCPPGIVPVCNEIAVQAVIAQKLDEGAGQVSMASGGVSDGLQQLSAGVPQLAGGVDQLAGGAAQLREGISQTSGGADQLADGADQLAAGLTGFADGAHKLSAGSGELSSGLDRAVEELPSYSEDEKTKLADVVADPVATSKGTDVGFGNTGLSVYAVLALWVGALATFLVLRPVPQRTLESTRSSFALALRHFRLPAGIAIAQGLLVAAVLGWAQAPSVGGWFATAGLAALTAVAFTAVNQALAAMLGGVGRFASMLVALIVLANGFISAVPAALGQLSAALPVGPALDALRAVTTGGSAPGWGALVLLVVWALSGVAVTWLAVERGRTVRATQLLATYGVRRAQPNAT